MNRRDVFTTTLWSALGLTAAPWALAQSASDYPKPGATLRYVVPFPPGGLTDVMARQVGQHIGDAWKVNVVVDNKPGGGAQIGAAEVAKAAGDGQTLLAITLAHAANVTLFKGRAGYDFQRDLKPVALLAGSPMVVVVPASSPVKDLKDLAARAKAGALNAGSSGNGTPPHLTLELFNDLAGVRIQHVPYKGGAPSLTDLIGGQLDVIFSNLPESAPHIKSGKLRALAITTAQRHPMLPEVSTAAEAGQPKLLVENWTGMMLPAATPDAIVAKLSAEVLKIMAMPDMQDKAKAQGFRVDARGPDSFAAFLKEEIDRWAKVITGAKITAD